MISSDFHRNQKSSARGCLALDSARGFHHRPEALDARPLAPKTTFRFLEFVLRFWKDFNFEDCRLLHSTRRENKHFNFKFSFPIPLFPAAWCKIHVEPERSTRQKIKQNRECKMQWPLSILVWVKLQLEKKWVILVRFWSHFCYSLPSKEAQKTLLVL